MRNLKIEWAAVLLLAGCASGPSTQGGDAGPDLEKGIKAANAGDHETAIHHFTKVIAKAPSAGLGYDLRAKSYAKLGKDDEALSDYAKAIAVAADVEKSLYLSNRARYHYTKGRHGKAQRDFDVAVARQKEWPHPLHLTDIYFNRAAFFLDTGRPEKCIEDCNYVLSLNPDESIKGNFERLRDEALAARNGSGK